MNEYELCMHVLVRTANKKYKLGRRAVPLLANN